MSNYKAANIGSFLRSGHKYMLEAKYWEITLSHRFKLSTPIPVVAYEKQIPRKFNCASNEFFCPESEMCLREDKVCDGVVQCPKGDDEEIEICKNRNKFPDGQ